ncbi:flagellar hook-associated protein 1 FlgK [Edaphobacter aggregans]|uniref:Flagellar hook-associated protein 1 n=1 Tax=Edaphobacter aggregans TaxID=570835 RepID=A0A428MDD4_9BACT|nr:flagellar hook-associated protein FlgK [Edaphobacter aggregans]RSL14874.1 flagellar hook-associated protein 1 FlgK [Edaphobacter aggregans]
MGTLTSLVDMSRSAMQADQMALDITSSNVSNQNTVGYTREVATWQSSDLVTINGNTYSTEGGVTAVSQRDRVLEQRVQTQTQTQAQSGALEAALEQVQNIFGLTSTSTSAVTTDIGSAMNSFSSSLSTLESDPSDASIRQSVITAAQTLVGAFNSASDQLAQVSSNLDQQAGSIVDQVNTLTATIASLNQQITSMSPNQDAGALEDQRQVAIAQLSQYVGLNQISTENNDITLTTSNGAVVVAGDQSYGMTTAQVSGVTHIFVGTNAEDVTSSLSGGSLGGVLQARDQELPGFVSTLDSLAYAIGTQVNQQNEQGIDGNGNSGQAIFTLPGSSGRAAGLIAVATTDPQAIAAAAMGEGSTGNGNATLLAGISTTSIVGGETTSSYYASLLARIGNATAGATTDNAAQQATLTQLTTQRDSLSGVSLDDEAANLTQYQRSYQAAAKVFSVADQIMASALNLGVETTVS